MSALGLLNAVFPKPLSSTAFSPNQIPGLRIWQDAKDESTLFKDNSATQPITDGGLVQRWNNKADPTVWMRATSSSRRPIWYDEGYIDFDGGNDRLDELGTFLVNTSFTWYFAFNYQFWAQEEIILQLDDDYVTTFFTSNEITYEPLALSLTVPIGGSGMILTGGHATTGNGFFRLNKNTALTGSATFTDITTYLLPGNLGDVSEQYLYELLLYEGTHDNSTQEQIIDYLAAKHSITI